jgi:hypothetical protein
MATKGSIILGIQSKVGSSYGVWRIGLTHDLAERKTYWQDTAQQSTKYWSEWTADSLSDAQEIESDFINKGMQSAASILAPYKIVDVYVF